MTDIPTAKELESLFTSGKLECIGMGSRRSCYRLPHSGLSLKHYRVDDEVGATVRREIARARFDRRLNTCAQEYDYLQEVKKLLPQEVLAVFPETFELREDSNIGWHLVESLVLNGDGSVPERFSRTYRAATPSLRKKLFAAFRNLMHAFEVAAIRFYDPQNVIVQWPGKAFDGEEFHLRIVDFEPASRTLLPIDLLLPCLRRMKLRRRVKRFLKSHLGLDYCDGQVPPYTKVASRKVNVLCLKWGQYYGPEYINRLYFGVRRFLSRPFRFVCVTDDPTGIVDGVDVVPFPDPPLGWKAEWPNIFIKLCVFQNGFANLSGPTLFLDIDQIIVGPLDRFFDYKPGEFCIIHNWVQFRKSLLRKRPKIGNSSCFRFEAGRMNHVYERFLAEQDRARDVRQFRTEQAYMTHAVGIENVNWWPKNWVKSFKRSCTWSFPLNLFLRPRIAKNTSILCFHGHPSPNEAVAGYPGKRHHPEQRTLPAPWVADLWAGEL